LNAGSWKIVFFGTPSFSLPTLEALVRSGDEVVAVVTQPDRERGRGRKVLPPPVKEVALRHGIEIFQPETMKDFAFQAALRNLEPDLFVVVAYGRILPKSVLAIPARGAVNVHASLLPRYRGASPIAWAILRGERETGVTTMLMDEGMDTGPILLQRKIPIEERETAETLHDKLASLGAELLIETLEKMKRGAITPLAQDTSQATYAPPLAKEDGEIDWTKEAREIDRKVRAFSPWPGAFTRWKGQLIKVCRGSVGKRSQQAMPGTVVWVGSDFIEVATSKDAYRIEEVQMEGKRRMSVREFLCGHPIPVGTVLGS
jgi:methionyl-tRNA formyltransferase